MSQLSKLKSLLGNPTVSDDNLEFYLDCAKDVICDIRNTTNVEQKYLTTQIQIAIELFNKVGAEGEVQHSELGITRTYEIADISPSLIRKITPVAKTPFSVVKVVCNEDA